MRRKTSDIPADEYAQLLKRAMEHVTRQLVRWKEEEISKMRSSDKEGDYETAELHEFKRRALQLAINALIPPEML